MPLPSKIFWIIQIFNLWQDWVLWDISWQLFYRESNTELFHFWILKMLTLAMFDKSSHLRTSIEHLLGTLLLSMKRGVLVTWSILFFFCFYSMSFPASFAVIASWIIHPNCVHTKPLSCVTVLIIWSLLLFSSKAGLEKREVGERLVGFCSEMELQWWRRWREGVESGNMATQKPPLSVHNMLWRNCITWIKLPQHLAFI